MDRDIRSDPASAAGSDYLQRLYKLIPTELTAAYLAIAALLTETDPAVPGAPGINPFDLYLFLAFLVLFAMVPFYEPALVVHRNDGWWRRYCPPSRPSCYAEDGESHQFFDPALAEKARADHLQDKVGVLDADLGRKFDGYPIPEIALDSWEQRRFFTRAPKDDPLCNKPGIACVVEYHLLRFSPTHWASTQAKLDFHANTWSVQGASIYVFSPEQEFDAHYTVNFSPP